MSNRIPQNKMDESKSQVMPERMDANSEIGFSELFVGVWAGKWIIITFTTIFAICAIMYALSLPNIYRAQALLAPVSSSNGGGLSSMARQFGGLASLAGINLSSNTGIDKTTFAIEVMQSRRFITNFIEKYDLLPPLMAAKGWDEKTNKLVYDPEVFDPQLNQWIQSSKHDGSVPSLWEAHKKFKAIFSISRIKGSSLVSVDIMNVSPHVAKRWVELIIDEINSFMKIKDLEEARNGIAYLNTQMKNTEVTDMHNVFYQLIEEQTKTIMLSEVREEYVFITVDPAVVPQEKSEPRRAVIVVVGTMLGGMISVLFVLIRHFNKK